MNNNTCFFTKDLYLGAYLYAQDAKLLEIQKDNTGGFLWFIFEDIKQCKELENKFWSKEALIELTSYLSALKTLKQRIFQYKAGGIKTEM